MNQKSSNAENHNNSKLDHDIQNLISSLTRHVANLSKQTNASDQDSGIITLAGSNKGAVMKAEFTEDGMINDNNTTDFGEETMNVYTNSNYQAINNSILIEGTLEAEDPGVHIELVDCIDVDEDEDKGNKMKDKKKDKGKKEKKEQHE